MNLKLRLIISMAAIGLIVLIGLSIIFQSATGVRGIAGEQKIQVQTQEESVVRLKEGVSTVVPALEIMNRISTLKNELASVQYAFANASLTLVNTDLTAANQAMDDLEPRVLKLLGSFPEYSSEAENVREAFWASRIYGNKMNEFLLKDLSNLAGDMARGLNAQMSVIASILDQLSNYSVSQVNSNVAEVVLLTDEVQDSAQAVREGVEQIVDESSTVSRAVLIVGTIVLLLTAGVAFSLSLTLNSATQQVVSKLSEISRDKNLSVRIGRAQNDELGIIAKDVDGMMEVFEEVVKQVTVTADGVHEEIGHMGGRSDGLNQLIANQQDALENISAAVTEMSASANEVSQNANITADTTQHAHDAGEKGSEIVNKSISNIENLSNQLNSSELTINQLVQDVENIGGILAVIESIAEQTNLLALNAAIEAARAGEQGRGFAVVADEVRSLAGRTQESTIEIRRTIENLQKRTEDVVDSMHQSIGLSADSVRQAQEANKAIEEISGSLSEIKNLTQLIASAAKEQSEASKEISSRITTLSGASMDVLDLARENKQGAERMSEQGEQLNAAISVFTV